MADGVEHVVYYAPHHKTDRRRDSIVYRIPAGILTDLLLLHLQHGHSVLEERVGRQPYLFMSGWGQQFSDATFCQYWYVLLNGNWLPGLRAFTPAFAPSKGRNIYVEHVTSVTGFAPESWEAQVRQMGRQDIVCAYVLVCGVCIHACMQLTCMRTCVGCVCMLGTMLH